MATILWAVTGSKFSAEAARAETFKNTNGQRGVTLPTDLKVSALPVPGAFVRVTPGGASLPAGYAAAPGQSYSVTQTSSVDVPVAATGSGGAVTKYLLLRLTDPQYEGATPSDPVNHDYSSFVWVTTLTGLNYPYVPLVKLVQPASTATITNAMLTDIRKLARGRIEREVTSMNNGAVSTITGTTSAAVWLNYTVTHTVPEWANWVHIIVHISGYFQTAALADAQIWPRIGGTLLGGSLVLDHDAWIDGQRFSLSATASGAIPAGFAGTAKVFDVIGQRIEWATHPGLIRADLSTHIAYDIQFEERIA